MGILLAEDKDPAQKILEVGDEKLRMNMEVGLHI